MDWFGQAWQWLLRVRPPDGGPVYTETQGNLDQLIVEPFNGLSAMLFLVIATVFSRRIAGAWQQHRFITYALPLLLIGGAGGTLYHLFRAERVFLFMDWMPILVLTLSASVYFIHKLTGTWERTLLLMLAVLGLMALSMVSFRREWIPRHLMITANYALMAITVTAPLLLYVLKRHWAHGRWFFAALGAFGAALLFRYLDGTPYTLPGIGTHWLWHCFGALATYCVLELVYRLEPSRKPQPRTVARL